MDKTGEEMFTWMSDGGEMEWGRKSEKKWRVQARVDGYRQMNAEGGGGGGDEVIRVWDGVATGEEEI